MVGYSFLSAAIAQLFSVGQLIKAGKIAPIDRVGLLIANNAAVGSHADFGCWPGTRGSFGWCSRAGEQSANLVEGEIGSGFGTAFGFGKTRIRARFTQELI